MNIHSKLSIVAAIASLSGSAALGQITFKNAFGTLKFDTPVYFGAFPGKPNTYVVLEQHQGLALIVSQKGNAWAKDTLLKLSVHQANEMGMLGIAFHPDYAANRKYYVSYDPPGQMYNKVDEFIADATGMKDSGTKPRSLFNIPDKYDNHNGGTIAFGPKDGYLYYGIGDGGSGYDPDGNAQNTNVLLGKFLRIDVNKKDPGLEYGIPADNPFAKGGGRGEIFAYGVRNPWKWSFDPLTGDLWLGDVGQDQIEEVDIVTLGGNYGWKIMEGLSGTNNGKMTLPIFTYNHSNTGTCIIGGVVFRGNTVSKYYGTYFTADINTRRFWALKKNGTGLATSEDLGTTPTGFSSFGTDADGRIYGVGISTGIIYLLESADLAVSIGNRMRTQPLLGGYGRSFTISRGERLDVSAFRSSSVLDLFSTDGARLGSVTREAGSLPGHIESGVYLLRPAHGSALPDLLVVR